MHLGLNAQPRDMLRLLETKLLKQNDTPGKGKFRLMQY